MAFFVEVRFRVASLINAPIEFGAYNTVYYGPTMQMSYAR